MNPKLQPNGFEKLLLALDPNRDVAGEKYEQARTKLLKYFQWQGADHPEELTDETMDRVVRKIEEGEQILNLNAFLYGVARFVVREARVKLQKRLTVIHPSSQIERMPVIPDDSADTEEEQERSDCLQSCLDKLSDQDRDLILRYYRFDKGAKIEDRKELADELGVPLNALRIRTFRIRMKLENCVRGCMKCSANSATLRNEGKR